MQSCLSVDGPLQDNFDWCGAGSRHRSGTCWRCWCPAGASYPQFLSSTSATTRRWCVSSPLWLHAALEGVAGVSTTGSSALCVGVSTGCNLVPASLLCAQLHPGFRPSGAQQTPPQQHFFEVLWDAGLLSLEFQHLRL